jgi:hypothetical protein
MKTVYFTLFSSIIFTLPITCFSETFTDNFGGVYKNAQVVIVNPTHVFITYTKDSKTSWGGIRLQNLPEHLQKRFNYSPQKPQEYREIMERREIETKQYLSTITRYSIIPASYQPPIESYSQTPGSYQTTVDSYGQPLDSYQSPIASYSQPIDFYQSAIVSYSLPVASYQPAIRSYSLTPASYQTAIMSYSLPIGSYQPPIASYSQKPASYQSAIASYSLTPGSYRPSITPAVMNYSIMPEISVWNHKHNKTALPHPQINTHNSTLNNNHCKATSHKPNSFGETEIETKAPHAWDIGKVAMSKPDIFGKTVTKIKYR